MSLKYKVFACLNILFRCTCSMGFLLRSSFDDAYKPGYEDLISNVSKYGFRNAKKNLVMIGADCLFCDSILRIFMNEPELSFVITTKENLVNITDVGVAAVVEHYTFLMLLSRNVSEITMQFANLRDHSAWNPRAKHLIVIFTNTSEEDLIRLFNEFWTHRVLNVGVTVYNREKAYTYNRYRNHSIEEVTASDLFYDKLRDMMGYSIRATYVPYVQKNAAKWIPEEKRYHFLGKDWGFAQAFFKTVNATADFFNLPEDRVHLYKNISYRLDHFKRQTFESTELWFNTVGDLIDHSERIEYVYPFGKDSVCFLVPKSGIWVPNIFEPYSQITWLIIVGSFVFFNIYNHLYYGMRGPNARICLSSFAIFFGQSVPSKKLTPREKLIYFMWTIFSLLVVNIYSGALYRTLSTVSYKPEMNQLTELYAKKITIYAYSTIYRVVRLYVPPEINVLEMNASISTRTMSTLRQSAFAYSANALQFSVRRTRYSENGVPFYHLMSQCLVPAYMTYSIPYGSPYLDKLNRAIRACREAGLDRYWAAEAVVEAILVGDIIHYVEKSNILKSLSLHTQIYGFAILGTGLMTSFLCFIAELHGEQILNRSQQIITKLMQKNGKL